MSSYQQTFSDSYARAVGNGSYNDAFISDFYQQFFNRSSEVAALFANTNMSAQKTMLHDSLNILREFHDSGIISDELSHLAKVHGRQGHQVPLRLYNLWLDCLMLSVAHFDPEFDHDIELAWRLVLIPGITYITFMADKT